MKKTLLLIITTLFTIQTQQVFAQSALGCNGVRYLNDIATDTTFTTIQYGINKNALGQQQNLLLDIIAPKGDTQSRRPVIILAFGGAFVTGKRADMGVLGWVFAKRGFVCLSIDYRLWNVAQQGLPDSGKIVPITIQAMQDMKAAVRWVRKSAKEGNPFKLDTNNIIVGGGSAGAITAMHVAHLDSTDNIPDFLRNVIKNEGGFEGNSGNPGFSSSVKGVINLSGGLYKSEWIDANDPPFISYHGTADNIVPYDVGANVYQFSTEGSAACYRQALKVKVPSLLRSVQGGGHTNIYEGLYLFSDLAPFLTDGSAFIQRLMCGQPPLASQDIDLQHLIQLYPNPATDEITVETGEFTEGVAYDATIYNTIGKAVYIVRNQNTPQLRIRKEVIGTGMFVLQLKSKTKVATKKFVFK